MQNKKEKLGVILVNLGTPDKPEKAAIRRYLAEFLSDPRVVDLPRLLWIPLLHAIILRIRPGRLVANYQMIWGEEDAPIRTFTQKLADKVMHQVSRQHTRPDIVVRSAMTYGNPSLSIVIDDVLNNGASDLLFIPLFPQYSSATTGAVFDKIAASFSRRRWIPSFRLINNYHNHPKYIHAITKSIEVYNDMLEKGTMLIFSFHGIPFSYHEAGDPYPLHCQTTAEQVAYRLALSETQWMLTFQSRFGPARWLQPYTDVTLSELPSRGIKSVLVVCPGFASDCLETLEEIAERGRKTFIEAGGEEFVYIPALNDSEDHSDIISSIVMSHLYSDEMPE